MFCAIDVQDKTAKIEKLVGCAHRVLNRNPSRVLPCLVKTTSRETPIMFHETDVMRVEGNHVSHVWCT